MFPPISVSPVTLLHGISHLPTCTPAATHFHGTKRTSASIPQTSTHIPINTTLFLTVFHRPPSGTLMHHDTAHATCHDPRADRHPPASRRNHTLCASPHHTTTPRGNTPQPHILCQPTQRHASKRIPPNAATSTSWHAATPLHKYTAHFFCISVCTSFLFP
eukprot:jgi/Psemu1/1399/gm1.1399_g